MLPSPEKTSIKRVLLVPTIVLAVLVATFLGGIMWMGARALSGTRIFHQTKTGWQQLPTLVGLPETLQVSSNGVLWVRTGGTSAMSCWDGKAWKYYAPADLGMKTGYINIDFALDGEQVWATTKEGMLHWDGQHWQLFKEAPASFGASTVAAGGQVWVIDHNGKFSHFQGGQWQSQKLDLPGANWEANSDAKSFPKLARTTNGTVWLVWHGLWRLDGSKWSRVTDVETRFKDAYLIGAAGDRLWFSDPTGLHSLSMDGEHWTVYTPEQTGLAKFATRAQYMVRDEASAGGRTWFGTSAGLLEFDGSEWRQLPLPSQQIAGLLGVAASPDGDLWVIGYSSAGSLQAFRYVTPVLLLLPLAMLGVIIWTLQRFRRRRLHQHQLVTQAVQHATGEIPDELQHGERQLKWRGRILIVLLGTGVVFYFVHRIWPQAPFWLIPVFALLIDLALTFQQSLVKRKPKASDPIGPGAPSGYDWGKAWKAVAGTVIIIAIMNADRLPMLKFLGGYNFWLVVLVPVGYNMLMTYLTNGALRRGDYDRALNLVRLFHFYNPSGMEPLRMSGHILLLAGRYREAEDTLRRSLVSSHARESYGHALEYLGDALMEQGRYDDATRSYEAALHAFSWRLRPYRGMAEMLLRRGSNPQQTLEYVEKIVDFTGLTAIQRSNNGRPQDDYWALKAWAQAAIGRTSEVAAAIENALKATDPKCLPDLATTHYRAGMAMQAMGNNSSANQHFQQAIDLDPNGRRGALAKTAMREQTVWGVVKV